MALPIKGEITAAWRALSDTSEDEGWRSIPISYKGRCPMQAARHFPDNDEALLVCFEPITLPQSSQLPQGTGFNVENASLGNSSKWVALIRQPQGSLDLFSLMVADIVTTLSANDSNDAHRLFQIFIGRIHAWQEFMKREREGLGLEAELGLVGELQCLEGLMDAGLPLDVVVEGWKGPMGGLQDFELGVGAIEVKSTLALVDFPAAIMSLEQLDDAVLQPLFVCGCRFSVESSGLSLPQRVEALRERLAVDPLASASFGSALLHSGFMDSHAKHYTRCFVISGFFFWLVDDTFPRLIPSNVPAGIRHAQYKINLDTSNDKQVQISEMIKMIGVV